MCLVCWVFINPWLFGHNRDRAHETPVTERKRLAESSGDTRRLAGTARTVGQIFGKRADALASANLWNRRKTRKPWSIRFKARGLGPNDWPQRGGETGFSARLRVKGHRRSGAKSGAKRTGLSSNRNDEASNQAQPTGFSQKPFPLSAPTQPLNSPYIPKKHPSAESASHQELWPAAHLEQRFTWAARARRTARGRARTPLHAPNWKGRSWFPTTYPLQVHGPTACANANAGFHEANNVPNE